jgi:hypothetical protein
LHPSMRTRAYVSSEFNSNQNALSIPKYLTLDFFDIILTTRIIQKIKFIYHFNGSIVYYIIYFNYIFVFQ